MALSGATADGAVLFAKNSDRPANEPQPLVWHPRRKHAPGAKLRCQYIEIEQAAETACLIGSRPYWLWGFEHGLNEHGVAVGNHTVFTKDELQGFGLVGMDVVRLALERGRSAAAAAGVITDLVERHGQGGSGFADKDWAYHNSFLVADRSEAYIVETSDRHWALRRIDGTGSASNHLTIGTDWDALAAGTIEHAIDRGWWREAEEGRFDFAAAYRDASVVPEFISSARHRRTCTLLEQGRGSLTPAALRRALRDHYEDGPVFSPRHEPGDERRYTVCMHAEPVGTTTAGMVARIPNRDTDVLAYWACLGAPCVGVFLPFYPRAGVPEILARAGAEPSRDSPWWRFKELSTRVEGNWAEHGPRVRAFWDEHEEGVAAQAQEVERRALGKGERGVAELREFSERSVGATLEKLEQLLQTF